MTELHLSGVAKKNEATKDATGPNLLPPIVLDEHLRDEPETGWSPSDWRNAAEKGSKEG